MLLLDAGALTVLEAAPPRCPWRPPGPEEWAEFLHLPGKLFTNFNEVRDEIVRDTNAKTGGDKGADKHPPVPAIACGGVTGCRALAALAPLCRWQASRLSRST